MNGFLLALRGPMMSFADTGFGQLREAGPFPSRSAVVGIIGAAMGIERSGERLLELHEQLRIHMATVRSGSLLVDYHTVLTAGYEPYDPVRLRREGAEGNPVLTSRTYHQDSCFLVLIESGNAELISEASAALLDPVFIPFLGRRSCPPSAPLTPIAMEFPESTLDSFSFHVKTLLTEFQQLPRLRRKKADRDIFFDLYADRELEKGEQKCMDGTVKPIGQSYRRDLLVALPRSYVNRPYWHYRMTYSEEFTTELLGLPPRAGKGAHTQGGIFEPSTNEDYFHAAP